MISIFCTRPWCYSNSLFVDLILLVLSHSVFLPIVSNEGFEAFLIELTVSFFHYLIPFSKIVLEI
jgi:hypothetical protein